MQACERGAQCGRPSRGTAVALIECGGLLMLMFKRSQLYIGLALAALAEIIVRAVGY
jgi:hypothetical protein